MKRAGGKTLQGPWSRPRRGFTALEITTVVTGLAVLLGIASYAYLQFKERALRNICHTQQRQLQKQLGSLGSVNVDVPMEEIFKLLINAGHLAGKVSQPDGALVSVQIQDPGSGPGSSKNYRILPGTLMVGCVKHGSAFSETQ